MNRMNVFFISGEENIILCGKIDWLEYVPSDGSLRVIDFKTGRSDEKEEDEDEIEKQNIII